MVPYLVLAGWPTFMQRFLPTRFGISFYASLICTKFECARNGVFCTAYAGTHSLDKDDMIDPDFSIERGRNSKKKHHRWLLFWWRMNPGHVLRLLFLSVLIQVIRAKEGLDPAEPIDVNKVHSPRAQCKFSVHDKNSTGPEVEGRFVLVGWLVNRSFRHKFESRTLLQDNLSQRRGLLFACC